MAVKGYIYILLSFECRALAVLQVVFTGVVRKMSECFFTKKELMYIDDLLPGTSLDDHKKTDKSVNQAFFLINLLLFKNLVLFIWGDGASAFLPGQLSVSLGCFLVNNI